jgi:uncharacterized membrane protein
MNKSRLEAISDGIFAIVMTILVIEIKVPELKDKVTDAAIWHQLEDIFPLVLAFFISFAITTSYWITHHFLITLLAKNVSRTLQYLNQLFLFFVSLILFSTHLLGRYHDSPLAVSVYSLNMVIVSLMVYALRKYIIHSRKVENHEFEEIGLSRQDIFYGKIRIWLPVACSILAMIFAYINITISLVILVIPVVIGAIPGLLGFIMKIFGDFGNNGASSKKA